MKIKKRDINKAVKFLTNKDNSQLLKGIIAIVIIIAIISGIYIIVDYNKEKSTNNVTFEEYLNSKTNTILNSTSIAANQNSNSSNTKENSNKTKSNTNNSSSSNSNEIKPNGKITNLTVKRVVDGDTLVLEKEGTEYKVRLIGVNTPESVHLDKTKNTEFGKVASEFTKKRLENKTVDIEFDAGPTDRYGRLLVYLYLDGVSYNEVLLEEGMAQVMIYSPNVKNAELYKSIEKVAKDKKVGLWKNN